MLANWYPKKPTAKVGPKTFEPILHTDPNAPWKKWNIVLLIMPFFKTKYVHLKYLLFRVPLLQIRIEIKQNLLWNNEIFVDLLRHSNT